MIKLFQTWLARWRCDHHYETVMFTHAGMGKIMKCAKCGREIW